MRPTKIFLDLDDVLNTFTLSALRWVGCPVEKFDYGKYDSAWGFDIIRAANALQKAFVFTQATFWNILPAKFWATVPQSQEFSWLLALCETLVGQENIFILTAAPRKVGNHVASAKVAWIRTHLPQWLQEQCFIGTSKYACASPNALLIDDTDKNVQAFRQAGGSAILVPRPWNSLHDFNTSHYITREFDRLFGPMYWQPWMRKEAA